MKKLDLLLYIILVIIFLSNTALGSEVNIYGEKTDVIIGEDIILKISAENKISQPTLTLQAEITPPTEMNVTSIDFTKSSEGQYTSTFMVDSGKKKDREVRIRSNKAGDFVVDAKVTYYYGNKKDEAQNYSLSILVKVREKSGQSNLTPISQGNEKRIPGFQLILTLSMILLIEIILNKKK